MPVVANMISICLLLYLKEILFVELFQWVIFEKGLVITRIVVLVSVYLLIYLFFRWILLTLNIIAKLPLIHFVNKLLGLLVGVLEGVFILWIFLYVVSLNDGFIFSYDILENINASNCIIQFLYEHNLIAYLIEAFISI